MTNNHILHVSKQLQERILEVVTAKKHSFPNDDYDGCADGLSLAMYIMRASMKMSHCTHSPCSSFKWHSKMATTTITMLPKSRNSKRNLSRDERYSIVHF